MDNMWKLQVMIIEKKIIGHDPCLVPIDVILTHDIASHHVQRLFPTHLS